MAIYELSSQLFDLAESVKRGKYGSNIADTKKLTEDFNLVLIKYEKLLDDTFDIDKELSPIRFIQQPPGSNLCGQACVAMILGKSLEEVIKVIGSNKTKTAQLISILESNGFNCYPSLRRVFMGWSEYVIKNKAYAIVKVPCAYNSKKSSHWILYYDGKIYDPYWNDVIYAFLGSPTSFLMVWKENK